MKQQEHNALDIKELTREDSPSFNKDEILTSRSGKSNMIGGFQMQFDDATPNRGDSKNRTFADSVLLGMGNKSQDKQ